jgi:prevent-host-death family protein
LQPSLISFSGCAQAKPECSVYKKAVDMAINMAYCMAMKVTNIADFKNNLSKILTVVEKGETVEIRKRNVPIAHLVPVKPKHRLNKTRLGCGRESVQVKADLTEPMIPEESWEMLKR